MPDTNGQTKRIDPGMAHEPAHAALARRIARAIAGARLALLWEDLWPKLVWPLGVVLSFVALSWLGTWAFLPDLVRLGLLIGFGLALLVACLPMRGLRLPSVEAGLARIERASGLANRPLQTLADSLPEGADAASRALWAAHQARLRASIGTLSIGLPAPGVARADRYGLRVVLALLLFVGYFAAGDTRLARIGAAFRPLAARAAPEARLDAWVTPPDYTGKPPILLTAGTESPLETDGTIHVPQGSLLVVRAAARADKRPIDVTMRDTGAAQPQPLTVKAGDPAAAPAAAIASADPDSKAAATTEYDLKLAVSTEIAVTRGGAQLASWRFTVIADTPPTIRFVGTPEAQASGTLKLAYEVTDDYGVTSAEAHFEPAPDLFPVVSNAASIRPLVTPPDYALSLPSGHAKAGQATSFRDLTAHPWAGGKVRVTLVAHNEAGLEGRSETRDITLPARGFTKPLARALVEQRRILALDANRQPQVDDAFDALLIAPEHFYESSGLFLGITKIYRDLLNAKSDDNLRDVVAFIWEVATGIEDGNLSQAEKAVRDAEDALQKALDQGASEQDIAKLTQALREALDKYMHELAEAARNNPSLRRLPSANQRVLRQQDLSRMLDRIENLAKTGSRDAARQMLSEMQRMLENLQRGEGDEQADQQQGEQSDALDKLGEMIQRQQKLMDQTHRFDRNGDQAEPRGHPESAAPPTPEERQRALKDLEQNQGDLRQALKELRDKLAQQGYGKKPAEPHAGDGTPSPNGKPQLPGKDGPPAKDPGEGDDSPFGQAGEAMGDARQALGDGDTEDAVDAQGRAIDKLREGAKKLVDEMAQNSGNRRRGGLSQGQDSAGDDPLGRPRRSGGPQDSNSVKVPDEIDTQRARQVLEDIRRRLSEPMRPRLELDYLERLLRGE